MSQVGIVPGSPPEPLETKQNFPHPMDIPAGSDQGVDQHFPSSNKYNDPRSSDGRVVATNLWPKMAIRSRTSGPCPEVAENMEKKKDKLKQGALAEGGGQGDRSANSRRHHPPKFFQPKNCQLHVHPSGTASRSNPPKGCHISRIAFRRSIELAWETFREIDHELGWTAGGPTGQYRWCW